MLVVFFCLCVSVVVVGVGVVAGVGITNDVVVSIVVCVVSEDCGVGCYVVEVVIVDVSIDGVCVVVDSDECVDVDGVGLIVVSRYGVWSCCCFGLV